MHPTVESEEDFEVKLDEDMINDIKRRESVTSKVFDRFKALPKAKIDDKRRVTTRRKRKQLPDFSGYLWKKSGSIFKGWQKRFVYLSQNRFCYYKTNCPGGVPGDIKDISEINIQDYTPTGIINLEIVDALVKIKKSDKQTFSIIIDGCKREFRFKARNQEERNAWGSNIIKHM